MTEAFPTGARLDNKDPRNKNFRALSASDGLIDFHSVDWQHYGPILRQLIGACTGYAGTQALNTKPLHKPRSAYLGEDVALDAYSLATTIDPFPGWFNRQTGKEDTGSSVTAAANAQRRLGHISEFRWAFGGSEALALLMSGPVIVGTTWKRSMFEADANGYLKVSGADDDLGHSYVWVNYSKRFRRIKILNSWGMRWGRYGYAYLHEEDALGLIDDNGEAVKYIL
jgi:hypothetical protein